ncbi:hypothetical protein [Roseibium polysiphoniae]|uniref:hypothetical protein n=1 Tax=Roseibium polysiphoniae TaxID=2571221 RepID=UPI003297D660
MRYAKFLSCSALALSLVSAPFPVVAQTTGPASVTGAPDVAGASETIIKEDLFSVSPVLETELSSDAAVALELQFTSSPNTEQALDVSGITAEGFTRTVSVNGEQIAQVVVTRLKKGEDYVDLEADQFTSQFTVNSARLVPTTAISVDGDEAEFVSAVARLSSEEEDVAETPDGDLEDTATEDSDVDGNGSGNEIADSYETPERLEAEEEEQREPNITFNVSTEGCEPVIDTASGVVRQQSLSQTLEDGIVTETDSCSPNGTVWVIQKNYEVCEDVVDLEGRIAVPQYASYYNDDKGARYDISDCQADASVTYAISEDTDACAALMDFDKEVATLQSQFSYRDRSGSDIVVRDCQPTETTFDMDRSYGSCADYVDLEQRFAQAQYSLSYTDSQAVLQQVAECSPDEDQTFPIVENADCTFTFDFENGLANINSTLSYNKDGVDTRVRECLPSDTMDPIVMTSDGSSCGYRHDFGAGISTQLAMWIYEHEGQAFQASPCITTDTTYTHVKVYDVDGVDTCPPIVDLASGFVARQYRTEMTVNGLTETIAACQPDEGNQIGIVSTTNGCNVPSLFEHDLNAGQSYGRERFYYMSPTQGQVYVSECQPSDVSFTHSIEPSGWQYDDTNLRAYPLVDVSINVNGSSYQVVGDYLQPGSTATDYSFVRNEDTPDTSMSYYEGCEQIIPTNRAKIFLRPDGSNFSVLAGDGLKTSGGDHCVRTTEPRVDVAGAMNIWSRGWDFTYTIGSGATKTYSYNSGNGLYNSVRLEGQGRYTFKSSRLRNRKDDTLCVYIYDLTQSRSKTAFPNGSVSYSAWKTLSESLRSRHGTCLQGY